MEAQERAHQIVEKVLRDYPIVNALEIQEGTLKAIIHLELGGLRKDMVGLRSGLE